MSFHDRVRHWSAIRITRRASAVQIRVPVPPAPGLVAVIAAAGHNGRVIEELIARMAALLEPLAAAGDQRQYFHATYQRTTTAVADELKRGGFADPDWVERWDVAFADLYLDALEADLAGRKPTLPWQIAFGAPAGLPPLRHVLLGMNAHINFDLPQAIVAVIGEDEFRDAALLARRLGRIDDGRVELHRRVVGSFDLSAELPQGIDPVGLVSFMARDKKAHQDLTFILDGPGGVEVVRGVGEDDVVATLTAMQQPGTGRRS